MRKLLFSILFILPAGFIWANNSADSAQAYLQKGLQAKAERRWQLAINHLQKAASFDSTNVMVLSTLGDVAYEMRQYNIAINAFEKVMLVEPKNSVAIEKLANLYFWFNNTTKATALATKMEELKIGGNRPDYIIGMCAYKEENYPIAINRLLNYLDSDPDNAEVTYNVGRAYVDLERYEKAIPFYEKAIQLDTKNFMRVYELGMVYFARVNYPKAIEKFEEAAARGMRQDADFLSNLANAYLNTGNSKKAIDIFKQALEKRPYSQSILTDLGYAYYYNKDYQEAIDTWDQVLQLDKTNARSLYMIGMAYQKKGEKGKGQALCDKAIEMDPSLSSMKQQKGGFGM
jgi:tetratricopeptide (TPR) repeat protein